MRGLRDPLQRAHLAGQPLARLAVTDDVRAQHLERDPLAVRPLREVHDTHAALADRGQQAVGTDHGRAGCRLGRGRHARDHPSGGARPGRATRPRRGSRRQQRTPAQSIQTQNKAGKAKRMLNRVWVAGATVSCAPMIATPDTMPRSGSAPPGTGWVLHMQYAEQTMATPRPPAIIRLMPAAAWSSASTPASVTTLGEAARSCPEPV